MNKFDGNAFHEDLEWLVGRTVDERAEFENSRILIVGASGFIGSWLALYFDFLMKTKKVKITLTLMRKTKGLHDIPWLNDSSKIEWICGDLVDFPHLDRKFTHVFFCATPSQPRTGMNNSEGIWNSTVLGTQKLLEVMSSQKVAPKFINLSSGAVYKLKENLGAPYSEEDLSSFGEINFVKTLFLQQPYEIAKFYSETMVEEAARRGNVLARNLRIFAVSGPLLPLDAHFAFGNFVDMARKNLPINISGSPYTVRSYVYITELVLWILKVCKVDLKGSVNLSGFEPIEIAQLANLFSVHSLNSKVTFLSPHSKSSSYFGKMEKFRRLTGLNQEISIDMQVKKHIEWAKKWSAFS